RPGEVADEGGVEVEALARSAWCAGRSGRSGGAGRSGWTGLTGIAFCAWRARWSRRTRIAAVAFRPRRASVAAGAFRPGRPGGPGDTLCTGWSSRARVAPRTLRACHVRAVKVPPPVRVGRERATVGVRTRRDEQRWILRHPGTVCANRDRSDR